jgi:hypothetical protein
MSAVDAPGAKRARSDAQHDHILAAARGTGFLALGSFFEVGVRFLIALMLARLLGADSYGLYVLAVSAATLFASFSALGLDDAMVRYVAIRSGAATSSAYEDHQARRSVATVGCSSASSCSWPRSPSPRASSTSRASRTCCASSRSSCRSCP